MYITIIYIAAHIPPTRLRIRTVITPCTHGHFAGNDARVARPHRSENPNCTRGSAPDAGMCPNFSTSVSSESLRKFRCYDEG
jgi:hypothetical protein